jgi:rubredoxin
MHDCPECGGEKEYLKSIPLWNSLNFFDVTYVALWKCKLCGHTW